MRNFVTVSSATFHSYTVNGGEYNSNDVSLSEVVGCLAAAFESSLRDVVAAMNAIIRQDGSEHDSYASPSELKVLRELFEFHEFVVKSIDNNGWDTESRVFVYSNLNTGRSVTWIHSVC